MVRHLHNNKTSVTFRWGVTPGRTWQINSSAEISFMFLFTAHRHLHQHLTTKRSVHSDCVKPLYIQTSGDIWTLPAFCVRNINTTSYSLWILLLYSHTDTLGHFTRGANGTRTFVFSQPLRKFSGKRPDFSSCLKAAYVSLFSFSRSICWVCHKRGLYTISCNFQQILYKYWMYEGMTPTQKSL